MTLCQILTGLGIDSLIWNRNQTYRGDKDVLKTKIKQKRNVIYSTDLLEVVLFFFMDKHSVFFKVWLEEPSSNLKLGQFSNL